MKIALETFEEFYRYAGLRLDMSKTEAIVIWNDGNIFHDELINIKWHSNLFKTLGIWYSLNNDQMLDLNIKGTLKKIHSLINMWSARSLSLKGKITVLKSLIMPHVLHVASVLYRSKDVIKKIVTMFFNFLWSNRKHGVSKATMVQPIEYGGLKLICIASMIKSCKVIWVKRLLNHIDAKWKQVSWFLLNKDKSQLFSTQNITVKGAQNKFL